MVAGKTRRLAPGDTVDVPPGTVHRVANDPELAFRAQVTFTPATGMLEFFEDLMRLEPNPASIARFARRHRQAVRLAAPYGTMLDLLGVFIR